MRRNVFLEQKVRAMIKHRVINSSAELIGYVNEVGFLPLLACRTAPGLSAEEAVDEQCDYVVHEEGGWSWPLWEWKGQVVQESGCAYGKFIDGKACFVSRDWWPDFCNLRRAVCPPPEEGSIEDAILMTLREEGDMLTRDLRAACGFTGKGERGKFDAYITRLQMACRIVTADFVYSVDRHGCTYGWGRSLLTTPERFLGRAACRTTRSPEESFERIAEHLCRLFPAWGEGEVRRFLRVRGK